MSGFTTIATICSSTSTQQHRGDISAKVVNKSDGVANVNIYITNKFNINEYLLVNIK